MNRPPGPAAPARTVLDNGLTLITAERSESPTVAVLLLYEAGSLDEPPGMSGLAHLMEHMMFRGTPRFPQGKIDGVTSSLGGINNAVTTSDYTAYYFVLPSEHWRVPLTIEADRMVNCSLEARQFETERRVVLEERGMVDDDPDSALDEAVHALAFERHPYRHPVAGLRKDIAALRLADLRSFYETRYVPGGATLAVVGGVRAADVASFVAAEFGRIDGTAASPRSTRPEAAPARARHVEVTGRDRAARIALAFRAPEAAHPDSPALEVLSGVLAGGRSSRLHRSLVIDDRVAVDVSADRVLQLCPGLFIISAVLRVGADPARLEGGIVSILDRLLDSGIDEHELGKAKALLELEYLLGLETSLGLAGSLAFWESLGGWELGPAFEDRVMSVTRSELLRALGTHFTRESMISAWRLAP